MKITKRKLFRRILWAAALLFILMNMVAFMQAYKFTHFADSTIEKTKKPEELTFYQKVKAVLTGINNPRPVNKILPSQKFEVIKLQSNKTIECWSIKRDSARGTVIIFHGYSADKSMMLDKSDEFLKMGYNTLLVDFMGSGGSEGNQTTVGFKEAEEVKTSYDYLVKTGEQKIFLFGTSMGAAAIIKAIHDYRLNPTAIIIECPFGSMYKTTCARFSTMGLPSFPMAALLVFWGGIQNGFWAFSNNPAEYAKAISCPTLLLYGGHDKNVSKEETGEIYSNLKGIKQLKTYPLAGHENYLLKYPTQWENDVRTFLKSIK